MAKKLFQNFELFSRNPLLAILPSEGKVDRLQGLTSSLFARYDRVLALAKEQDFDTNEEERRRINAELGMLRQVLDWLEVKPSESQEGGSG